MLVIASQIRASSLIRPTSIDSPWLVKPLSAELLSRSETRQQHSTEVSQARQPQKGHAKEPIWPGVRRAQGARSLSRRRRPIAGDVLEDDDGQFLSGPCRQSSPQAPRQDRVARTWAAVLLC